MDNSQVQHVIETIKALVPKSFEKTFASVSDVGVTAGMQICLAGLTTDQINTGLSAVMEKGFCPDPALFRRWCLGMTDFENSVATSYIGKHGALADITAWLTNKDHPITVAMKNAYDKTYVLWNDVKTATDRTKAEKAFMDAYEHIVGELVADKIPCQPYIPKPAIQTTQQTESLSHHERAMADMQLKIARLNACKQARLSRQGASA